MRDEGAGLTGLSILEWARASRGALIKARVEIDALNVFPVPDGDTGTNLYLTMDAACSELESSGAAGIDAGAAATALARGALLGARGNSGVILSQILRGIGTVLSAAPVVDAHAVSNAFRAGADEAYRAVSRPVEGTILTVARAAADAAESMVNSMPGSGDVFAVVGAASEGARDALARTPAMLEVLRLAGVVDAGGRGLVEVYDALRMVLGGEAGDHPSPVVSLDRTHSGGPTFEVMYLVHSSADRIDVLRTDLNARGDSVVVVGGDGLWNVHVHSDDAGGCVEDGIKAGTPHRIRITTLPDPNRAHTGRSLVMVTHGAGIANLVADVGVHCVAAQPLTRPSVSEMLAAADSSKDSEVVLLPSDGDTQSVAELAAVHLREAGRRVAIVPTRSVVQSLAAVAVHDASRNFDDDVVTMTRAAGATRYGAITHAVRAALTTAGECVVGDVLGLIDGDIVELGVSESDVSRAVLARMLAVGGELVTIVSGSQSHERDVDALMNWVQASFPGTDVVHHVGGQPLWPLIIGVE